MTADKPMVDWPTVLKVMAGGALTGTGIGAATSFMRHLEALREQAAKEQDTSGDDNILYLNLPPRKQASATNTSSTFALSGLGGLVGAYAAYNLVRNAYLKQRKKQVQHELDGAQQIYLGQLGDPGMKAASQFGLLTKGVGSAYLAMLAAALGSAVVTNKLLQSQFPPVTRPQQNRPRKVVIRSANPEEQEVSGDVSPDAVEGLVRTHLQDPKSASIDCGFADLTAAAAAGRCGEIRQLLADGGVDAMFDGVKGARHTKVSNLDRNLAVTWMVAQPGVSEAIRPVLAGELTDRMPGLCKLASYIDQRYHRDLTGLVEATTRDCRRQAYAPVVAHLGKSASTLKSLAVAGLVENALLAQTIEKALEDKRKQNPDGQRQDTSAVTGQMSPENPQDPEKTLFEVQDDEGKEFADRYGTTINNTLASV